jgi:opacity protein-like surface antigen
MKKIMILFILLTGAAVFTASAQSTADRAIIKDTFGFGPKLGYYKAQDADEGNFYGGFQARLRLGPVIGIEGSVEYRAGQQYGIGNHTLQTSFIPLTGSLLVFVPVSDAFAPYAVAGIGAYYTRYEFSGIASEIGLNDDSDFNMGYHFGFGAEFPLSPHVALNADYRYLFLNPHRNEESLDGANFNGNVITAGLMFYF